MSRTPEEATMGGQRMAPSTRFTLMARATLNVAIGTTLLIGIVFAAELAMPASPRWLIALSALVLAVPLLVAMLRWGIMRSVREAVLAVSDGLLSLAERDYSLRLALERNDEVGRLVARFNRLTEVLRRERNDAFQREILLETVLGATSMIAVLVNEAMRVVYSNQAARKFFGDGRKLEGRDFRELVADAPSDVRQALEGSSDILFTCDRPGAEVETFHLSKRYFEISTQQHTLFLLKPLTKELARKEVDTWKKAIRVLSHEVNNSLAPVSSLVHSAKLMVGHPEHAARLASALDTIEDRARHLKTFLDGYAGFARLPLPTKKPVLWKELLAGVEGLYPFRVEGEVPEAPWQVDPAQMQQVLINLLKNAVESGSECNDISIAFPRVPEGVEFQVLDRGKGMSDEVIKNALLPFYSTKKSGSGLGLALCREIVEAHGGRLSLHPREGGGTAVRCWLP